MSFSRKLKKYSETDWEAKYHHPFVQQLGQGTLATDKFQFKKNEFSKANSSCKKDTIVS